jgi:hypothetical protein
VHEIPLRPVVPSTFVTVHAGGPPVGSVDVSTLPASSVATHSVVEGHETADSASGAWFSIWTGAAHDGAGATATAEPTSKPVPDAATTIDKTIIERVRGLRAPTPSRAGGPAV